MNDKMKSQRLVELVLAGTSTAITVVSSVGLIGWLIHYLNATPAGTGMLWLYVLIQAEWLISGLGGLAGVALDAQDGSRYWGYLTWASIGGLLGAMLNSALSIAYFVLPAVVLLCIAA